MKLSCILFVDADGHVRATKEPRTFKGHEVAIKLNLTIPDAMFGPRMEADITVKDGSAPSIGAKEIANIKDAVIEATGLDISLTVKHEFSQ